MNSNPLFSSLEEITRNLEFKRLADVFRFVSFQSFETYGPHEHKRIEINFVKKGSCILHLDNESVFFKENEIMIICPHVKHTFESGAKGCTLMQLEFLPDIFEKFSSSENGISDELAPFTIFSESNRLIKIVNNVRIMRSIQRILIELNSKNKYYHYLVIMYYAELMILLFRHLDETYLPIGTNENLKNAIHFLRSNYAGDISIDDVAKHVGISERYMRKLFAEHLNITPVDYLNQIRINKSLELLKNTELSVKEVSFMCGFKSPQYFSRVFKSQIGITPKNTSNI